MPDLPISGLPAAGALASGDLAVIVQGGVTVQTTVGAFASFSAAFTLATAIPALGAAAALAGGDEFLVYQGGVPLLTTAADLAGYVVTDPAFDPAVEAAVLGYLVAGANITLTPGVGSLTIDATGGGGGFDINPGYRSGAFYTYRGAATSSGTASTVDLLQMIPFVVGRATTIDGLAIRTGTANAVAGNVLLGIYANASPGPGALLAGTGNIAVAGTPNVNYAAAITPTALSPGVYWLACLTDAAIAMVGVVGTDPVIVSIMGGGSMQTAIGTGNPNTGWQLANVFALGLPASAAGAVIMINNRPCVGIEIQ